MDSDSRPQSSSNKASDVDSASIWNGPAGDLTRQAVLRQQCLNVLQPPFQGTSSHASAASAHASASSGRSACHDTAAPGYARSSACCQPTFAAASNSTGYTGCFEHAANTRCCVARSCFAFPALQHAAADGTAAACVFYTATATCPQQLVQQLLKQQKPAGQRSAQQQLDQQQLPFQQNLGTQDVPAVAPTASRQRVVRRTTPVLPGNIWCVMLQTGLLDLNYLTPVIVCRQGST